ncbi:LOW QUALITY PROTEIN: hypothetical protein U9M48_037607 [Paspalum notatum var. saurae]|uniref:Uncharacterized protein n=1 Tax=Paspalum notatum var. saurae TaxID=547442 RepID=A0AAQ3XCL1_PASNO
MDKYSSYVEEPANRVDESTTRSSGRLLLLLLAIILVGTCGGGAGKQPTIRSAAVFGIPNWHLAAPYPLGSAAAIHIGNTNSCIAAYDFRPGTNDYYQLCIPSWVAVKADGTTLAGEAAMKHAAVSPVSRAASSAVAPTAPATAVSGFTRLLHLRLEDDVVQNEMKRAPYKFSEVAGRAAIKIQAGKTTTTKELSPVDLSIILMTELRRRAEAHLGRELRSAVIAVPRHLNRDARQSVASAGWLGAGFRGGAKVIDRQIAAAAAYGHPEARGDGKAILVLRVGNRTSDAAIIKFVNGAARLVHARDDIGLGGDDFTARIVDYMAELIMEQRWTSGRNAEALRALTVACEHAKKALSDQEETVELHVGGGGGGAGFFSAPLTRAKLEELNQDLLEKAVRLVDSVVMGAPPSWLLPRDERRNDMVDEIVLVGGSARIPKLGQLVEEYFHGRGANRRKGVEAEDAIIQGTAILSRPEWAPNVEECFHHIYRPHFATYIPRNPHKPRDPTKIRSDLLPLPLSECKGKELGQDCIYI